MVVRKTTFSKREWREHKKFRADYSKRVKRREGLIEGITQERRLSFRDSVVFLTTHATEQKRVLKKLFERPLTTRTAALEFSRDEQQLETHLHVPVRRINRAFRRRFQKDAVLKLPLWNFKTEDKTYFRRFWVLMLNPEIFDVPEKAKLRPGIDVKLGDLPLCWRRTIFYVHSHPYCSRQELCKRFKQWNVIRVRTDCKAKNLHPMVKLSISPPLLKTRTEPDLYWANPRFEILYGLPISAIKNHRQLHELFSEKDVKLLRRLADLKTATLRALAVDEKLRTVLWRLNNINKRCKELEWPSAAAELEPEGTRKRFKMTDEFRERSAEQLAA